MNAITLLKDSGQIRTLVQRAADTLSGATSAADILDARDQAAFAYGVAKDANRVARAKEAHDVLLSDLYRVQADALEIESLAKRRLADEIDAAQGRGEVASAGQPSIVPDGNNKPAMFAEVGLSRKEVFEARQIRDAIASEPGALRRALDDILKAGDEPTKARLKRELAPAVNTFRAERTAEKKERRTARELDLAGRIQALPEKKYGLILGDPEWKFEPYSRETGMDRAPENHYPTSETDDIAARDVASIAADDSVLALYGTAPMLLHALRVMEDWGFEYKTHLVWLKQRSGDGRGPGYWFTGEHELLLIGTRGKPPAPAPGTQWRSVIIAPVGEHSEKPEMVLEMLEEYFPNLPKIEMNRRGPARPGWDAWGNEAEAVNHHPDDRHSTSFSGTNPTASSGGGR